MDSIFLPFYRSLISDKLKENLRTKSDLLYKETQLFITTLY